MCLIVFNWSPGDSVQLRIASNRDEFYDRPTSPAHWWPETSDKQISILAGRDLQANGAWLGVTRNGRLAAVTNYRDPANLRLQAESRGLLVKQFLLGEDQTDIDSFVNKLRLQREKYNHYNLLMYDGITLVGYSSFNDLLTVFKPGFHAVSNACFDTVWPKTMQAKTRMATALALHDEKDITAALFDLLSDKTEAADAQLPSTGVSLERERALSAAFIKLDGYGTRSSTLVKIEHDEVLFIERNFVPPLAEDKCFRFSKEYSFRSTPSER